MLLPFVGQYILWLRVVTATQAITVNTTYGIIKSCIKLCMWMKVSFGEQVIQKFSHASRSRIAAESLFPCNPVHHDGHTGQSLILSYLPKVWSTARGKLTALEWKGHNRW
jgi:hypothetical protein